MELHIHRFCELFAQLGLPSDSPSVRDFIRRHAPLHGTLRLEEAPFWSPAQAQLLAELARDDADWAEIVDQLNLALRRARS